MWSSEMATAFRICVLLGRDIACKRPRCILASRLSQIAPVLTLTSVEYKHRMVRLTIGEYSQQMATVQSCPRPETGVCLEIKHLQMAIACITDILHRQQGVGKAKTRSQALRAWG